MHPDRPSDILIYVILFKVVCVILDALFVRSQYKIKKENPTNIARSEYIALVSVLLFDASALVSLFCVWLLRNNVVSWYISLAIDISMSFSNSTTFSEIAALQKAMQEELSGEIENSHIAIVID